jgi:NADH-quinone oxidoreductase subunit M
VSFPILTSIVVLPALGAAVLLLIRDERNQALIRRTALVVSTLVFAETLLLAWVFNPGSADFQFVERYEWIPAFGISYAVGVDGISLWLVVLICLV